MVEGQNEDIVSDISQDKTVSIKLRMGCQLHVWQTMYSIQNLIVKSTVEWHILWMQV